MSEQAPENALPRFVDARKLVNVDARFERLISPSELHRVAEASVSIKRAEANLLFSRDEQNRPTLSGMVNSELELECQRCLEPLTFSFERSIHLMIVWDEAQAKALPKHLDPWIVGEGEVDLIDIIEEEMLLALPVVAKHDYECVDINAFGADEKVSEEAKPDSPFSVLANFDLKK